MQTKIGAIDIDLYWSIEDLEACIKVVRVLGGNFELFRLPQCRELRAALHPLIVEQYKSKYSGSDSNNNSSSSSSNGDGHSNNSNNNSNSRRKRGRSGNSSGNSSSSSSSAVGREQLLKELDQTYINRTQLRAIRQVRYHFSYSMVSTVRYGVLSCIFSQSCIINYYVYLIIYNLHFIIYNLHFIIYNSHFIIFCLHYISM